MTFEHSEYVDAAPEVVWDFLTSPGAMRRLMPAWSALRPRAEAASVRDGVAILGLPGPFTWRAQHRSEGYQPGQQFVDEVVGGDWRSAPAGMLPWRHTHQVLPEGPGARVVDRIETPVPARLLRRMFRWRGDVLRSDLAARQRVVSIGAWPAAVAVTGSGGLVGQALCAVLGTAGVRVVRLVRGHAEGPDVRTWSPGAPDPRLLDGVGALVHLAGEPIAGRFTRAHRAAIRESRVGPTRRLAELAGRAGLDTFVCASAIGIYGAQRTGERLSEDSVAPIARAGDDFLVDVVRQWEAATTPAADAGVRTVNVRTGIALSAAGGVLPLLRRVYVTGLGGRLGSGRQMMSWIDLDDLVDIYCRALVDPSLVGPVNATSPHAVDAARFATTLGHVMHRPALVPVPALGPRLLLGRQGADELALADQRVVPEVLAARGHVFRRPDLVDSLAHQLGRH